MDGVEAGGAPLAVCIHQLHDLEILPSRGVREEGAAGVLEEGDEVAACGVVAGGQAGRQPEGKQACSRA